MAKDLQDQLAEILADYSQAVQDATEEAVNEVAEAAVEKIKPIGGYNDRTGKYRKSFYTREEREGLIYRRRLANKRFQLTHLLEHGHLTVDGTTRTREFTHWQETEDYVLDKLPDVLAKKLKEAGG